MEVSTHDVDARPEWSELRTGRKIRVGTAEPLREATLVCERDGDDVIVYLKRKRRGRTVLRYSPRTPVANGQLLDEGHFTECRGAYEACSPWHDGTTHFTLFTIEDLRRQGGGRVPTEEEERERHTREGWRLFRGGEFNRARVHLEQARELGDAQDPWLLGVLERCVREEAEEDPSLLPYLEEIVDDQMDLRPESFIGRAQRAHALNIRAWDLYESEEDLDLALSLVDEALRVSPNQLCAQDTRARLLIALWRADEAARVVRFIEETAPFFEDSQDLFTGRECILPGFFKVRDKALRMFARATGLSAREIAGLTFPRVNLSEGAVSVGQAFGNKSLRVEGRALDAMREWFLLYLSFGKRVAKMKKQVLFVDDRHRPLTVDAIEAVCG